MRIPKVKGSMATDSNTATSYEVEIICPHCSSDARIHLPEEWWSDAQCPICKHRISASDYDKTVSPLIIMQSKSSASIGRLRKIVTRHKNPRTPLEKILFRPFRYFDKRFLARRITRLGDKNKLLNEKLVAYQNSRYALSSWYRCSRTSLNPEAVTGDKRSRLTASHNKNGTFHLTGNDNRCSGIIGEFIVYEALAYADPLQYPSLNSARICHRLYLPEWMGPHSRKKDETDLILLTPSCAVICEVKRWHASIQYLPHLKNVLVHRYDHVSDGVDEFEDNYQLVNQLEKRHSDFEALEHYPEDRILHALIFVNPVKLEAPTASFVDSCLVASYYENGGGTLLGALDEKLSAYDPIYLQSDVESIAMSVQTEYGDPDGKIVRHFLNASRNNSGVSSPNRKTDVSAPRTGKNAGHPRFSQKALKRKQKRFKQPKRKAFTECRPQVKEHKKRIEQIEEQDLYEETFEFYR